jgi:putative glutamine amidotransferase
MKRIFLKKFFFLTLCILWILGGILVSQVPDRFFDEDLDPQELRLTIFAPSVSRIKSIVELRKNGLLPSENLVAIGVYHEREKTDYQKAKEFVEQNRLDWFKFHKISAPLSKDNLFQLNPCTMEFEAIFKKSDGIIFLGGGDMPPYIYKEKTLLLTDIETPIRHFLELSCIYHLLGGHQDRDFQGFLETDPEFPILGICLGFQSLNVGTGGTLIQDIWTEVYGKKYLEDGIRLSKEKWHANPFADLYPEAKLSERNIHSIKLRKKGKFCAEWGFQKQDRPYILSSHHQTLKKLGKGFKIAATSLDGKIVEAIEHEKFPNVLGVQFHPEAVDLWNAESIFKLTPEDKEKKTYRNVLEDNPPSLAFHQKIWTWLSQKLMEYHKKK